MENKEIAFVSLKVEICLIKCERNTSLNPTKCIIEVRAVLRGCVLGSTTYYTLNPQVPNCLPVLDSSVISANLTSFSLPF